MVTPPGVPDETVKDMKPSFKSRYGKRWKEVLYATLWKHKGSYAEETQLDETRGWLEKCPCGSGEPADLRYDARGIPLGYMCSKCEKKKLSGYRPDVLTDPNYWHDEPIDNEETGLHRQDMIFDEIREHIVKHGSGYRLLSHKGKNLGTFKTRAAAAKHEGEVEYFKHHEETQLDEAKKKPVSWNPPEVQAKAAKFKKEQRMFDKAKREINRLKRQGK